MKRLVLLLCILFALSGACSAYATEDLSSTVISSEVQSAPISSEPEISSEPGDASSIPEVSSEASSEASSEKPVSSRPQSARPESSYDSDRSVGQNLTDGDSDKPNKKSGFYMFGYIIAGLVGVCLVVMIVGGSFLPVSAKKRELAKIYGTKAHSHKPRENPKQGIHTAAKNQRTANRASQQSKTRTPTKNR